MTRTEAESVLYTLAIAAMLKTTEKMESLVRLPWVRSFYIGRTNRLEERRKEEGADVMIPLFPASNMRGLVRALESVLLNVARQYPHNRNRARDSRGDEGVGPECVYLAVWL
jgi:hypothetical protein